MTKGLKGKTLIGFLKQSCIGHLIRHIASYDVAYNLMTTGTFFLLSTHRILNNCQASKMGSDTGNELTNKQKKIICSLVTYISMEEAENKLNIQPLN